MKSTMKRKLPLAVTAATFSATAFGASAEETGFDENAVAAMKGDIVIEAPYALSTKDDEIVVYMTVHNSADAADAITGVASEAAKSAALARYEGKGEEKTSAELDKIDAPANEAVLLHQRGYHVVLTKLNKPVEGGDVIPLTLTFEEVGDLEVQVSVAVMN